MVLAVKGDSAGEMRGARVTDWRTIQITGFAGHRIESKTQCFYTTEGMLN